MHVCVCDGCMFVCDGCMFVCGGYMFVCDGCMFVCDGYMFVFDGQEDEGVAEGAEGREERRRTRYPVDQAVQPHCLTSWKPKFRPNQVSLETKVASC